MRLAKWKNYVKCRKILLKINAMQHQLVPGTNTSPWVLEGVIEEIQKQKPKVEKIIVGDSDLASCKNVDKAAELGLL